MKREITNSKDVVFISERIPVQITNEEIYTSLSNIYKHKRDVSGVLVAFAYGYALAKHDFRKRLNRTAIRKSLKM